MDISRLRLTATKRRRTIFKVAYIDPASHGDSSEQSKRVFMPTYALLTCEEKPAPPLDRYVAEEAFAQPKDFAPTAAPPQGLAFPNPAVTASWKVELAQSKDAWATPCSSFDLQPYESALCVASVKLNVARVSAVQASMKDFVVVGTGFTYPEGEEKAGMGRLLIFELQHVRTYDEDTPAAHPRSIPRLNLFAEEALFGPITAVVAINGMLVIALGSIPASIKMFRLDAVSHKIQVRGFLDTPSSVVSIKAVKSFVLISTLHNGIGFIQWSEKQKRFASLARDGEKSRAYDAEYIIDGGKLGLVVGDENGGLRVLQYAPKSKTPQRLSCSSDVHIGSRVGAMVSRPLKHLGRLKRSAGMQTSVVMGFLDGGVGALLPVPETTFRMLSLLQTKLNELLHFNAGLNPKSWRLYKQPAAAAQRHAKPNIIDGNIVAAYASLTFSDQNKLAKMCGTTSATIIDHLLRIELSSEW